MEYEQLREKIKRVATGYDGACYGSSIEGEQQEIHLYYESIKEAEDAFKALCELIDWALKTESACD